MQRVWLAILLAVAGGGPLPLWLHHMQCHCSSDGSAPCDGSAQCGGAATHCHHHHHHHGHEHSQPAARVAVTPAAKATGVHVARSAGSEHGECAACYCLSQLSLSAPHRAVELSFRCLLLRAPDPDRIPEFDLLTAYSSRAPPAI